MSRRRAAVMAVLVVLGVVAALAVRHTFRPRTIWIVGMVPLADTERFSARLAGEITRTSPERVAIQLRNACGDAKQLRQTCEDANDGHADLVIAVGVDAAVQAYATVRRVPVVYCLVPHADALGLNAARTADAPFTGVSEDVPAETYCQALSEIDRKWGDAAVILPKGYAPGEAEAQAFGHAYQNAFNGTVKVMAIDAQTCAQLLDVVTAYNLVIAQTVDVYYAVSDGNIAKYMGMIVGQCTRRSIPVVGGGEPLLSLGGMLALTPDRDAEAKQCAEMVARILAGKDCPPAKAGPYVTLWNTNAMEQLGLSRKPAP